MSVKCEFCERTVETTPAELEKTQAEMREHYREEHSTPDPERYSVAIIQKLPEGQWRALFDRIRSLFDRRRQN